jgi:hypothetical protein
MLAACARQPTPELARDELFTLSIGPLDEQLNLLRIAGAAARSATSIYMRDGLFYIANGSGDKVMQLSSYGDLILLIYDPDSNPEPVGFARPAGAGARGFAATRSAVPHAFNQLSHIAVDRGGRIAVVDAVAAAGGAAGGQIVRRFSPRGEHLDDLGQQGAGGAPFPLVHRLTVTADDGLAVTARSLRQWLVFWYDGAGTLLERTELPHVRQVGEQEALVTRDVFPHLRERRLTLVVEAWLPSGGPRAEEAAATSGTPAGADRLGGPEIRVYDVASRSVVAEFPVPDSAAETVGAASYHPLGVTSGGQLFLTRREDDRTHSLLILGRGGRVITRRLLKLEEAGLSYVSLGMTAGGVLFGLLAEADTARVVWWRGDLLISGGNLH